LSLKLRLLFFLLCQAIRPTLCLLVHLALLKVLQELSLLLDQLCISLFQFLAASLSFGLHFSSASQLRHGGDEGLLACALLALALGEETFLEVVEYLFFLLLGLLFI